MITDFFLGLFIAVATWVLNLFPEHTGFPTDITDAIGGVNGLFSQTGAFFGALDHWFPVGPFLGVAAVAITVELGIALIRGIRVVKQLLPFQ